MPKLDRVIELLEGRIRRGDYALRTIPPDSSLAGVPAFLLFSAASRFTKPPGPVAPTMCFYTTDDGKTLFEGPIDHPANFEHDGLPDVEAGVFTCDGGSHQWVAFLRKGELVKRPGDAEWVNQKGPHGDEILNVKCPDGAGRPAPVWP